MLQFTVIGNLGGNAEVHTDNGQKYVTFRVGHTDRRQDAQGNTVEDVVWVSCILNGDGGSLTQYLVKGQKVCVIGDGSLRTYHSEKQRRLVAGANLFVRSVELVGARPEAVPRALFDTDGVQVDVVKYYNAQGKASTTLFDRANNEYTVDPNGWVVAVKQENQPTEQPTEADEKPFDGQGYETVEEAQQKKKENKKKTEK